jgi:hypothetical protein
MGINIPVDIKKFIKDQKFHTKGYREIINKLEDKIDRLLYILEEYTSWERNRGIYPTQKPTHGSCCTCQDCGYDHDQCVCEHNEIERMLEEK